MKILKLLLWTIVVLHQYWLVLAVIKVQSSAVQTSDLQAREQPSAASTLGSLYRKSRQSRCVRCYEDSYRYGDDRGRYSGYSSRSAGDERSNWYYPSYDRQSSYDRYDDRRYDDRYSSYNRDDRYRDDRYSPRSSYYDRYEGRYDDRRGYGGYGNDRGESRGYDRDYYYRDRNYERPRSGYDRDYSDRYYSRYDYRNYRPWDETYRGQSGFDNSGRGYYFANNYEGKKYLPEEDTHYRPCGMQVTNCGHGYAYPPPRDSRPGGQSSYNGQSGSSSGSSSGSTGGSSPGGYNSANNNANSNGNSNSNPNNNNPSSNTNKSTWNEQDQGSRVGSRDRDRDQQSSSYGGRSPRPLGGSYLFDRDSNVISDGQVNDANANTANASGDVNENAKLEQKGIEGASVAYQVQAMEVDKQ